MYFKHETAIVESNKIGEGTKIWAFSHICRGARIGKNCTIGEGVYIGPNVVIGNDVKIQNHSLIYEGLEIGDNVFIGPSVVTTNDIFPSSAGEWKNRFRKTYINRGSSIGANSTIVCGISIGENVMIGAGSVVTKDIPSGKIAYGNPAKIKGDRDARYSQKYI